MLDVRYERRRRTLALLQTLRPARETLQRGDAGGSFHPDSRLLLMPDVWHQGDYEELCKQLATLRRMAPGHHRQVNGRYLASEITTLRLAERGGALFEVESYNIGGEVSYFVGDRLSLKHTSVLFAVTIKRAGSPVIVRARRKGEGDGRLVQARLERWPEWIRPQMVERSVDFLSALMPERPRLPRVIVNALAEGSLKLAA